MIKIISLPLQEGEYYKEDTKKCQIFLHHTAGSHNPINTIHGWETDRSKAGGVLAVATSFVIGGLSTTVKAKNANGVSFYDIQHDGVVYQTFPTENWAHHLGTSLPQNTLLNKQSIGIEVCNYGPLTKTKEGKFLNYVNKEVPAEMVETLDAPFRNFLYYHKYTMEQVIAVHDLMQELSKKHGIDLKRGMCSRLNKTQTTKADILSTAFGVSLDAQNGLPGVWSHSNVRSDKYDIYPSKLMIEMLKSL